MVLETDERNWSRDGLLVSTEKRYLQVDAINEAMGSEIMWWAKSLPKETLQKALDNSLCLGLYILPQKWPARNANMQQIGLVRLITDDVTFAYLTDVYVLPEYQGNGLGRWMLECLDEVIKGWPHLRRFVFLTSSIDLYRKTIGAKEWDECKNDGIIVGLIEGPGALHV
ncbi:hypothetical protein GGS20DRAFT_59487 [Poronia punctata]|nr:hypothetical protein GGS20DRAFT_59487 [Poronia punctata]